MSDEPPKPERFDPKAHRLLPCSASAEKGVICSFLLAPEEVGDYCTDHRITRDHYEHESH